MIRNVCLFALVALAGIAIVFVFSWMLYAAEPEHCSTLGQHPCKCPTMLAEVYDKHVAKCEEEAKGDKKKRARCMEDAPDHCSVISYPDQYGYYANNLLRCKTSCKPERCACHDTVCRPHEHDESN